MACARATAGGSRRRRRSKLAGHCLPGQQRAAVAHATASATAAAGQASWAHSPLAGQRCAPHPLVHELIHAHGLGGFALGNRVVRRACRARRPLLPSAALLPPALVVIRCVAAQHRNLQKRGRLVVLGCAGCCQCSMQRCSKADNRQGGLRPPAPPSEAATSSPPPTCAALMVVPTLSSVR